MKIITITYNDLGISYGPAIHFLELWNSVSAIGAGVEVEGLSPSWTARRPILAARFKLRQVRVPNVGTIRQVIYDWRVALRLLWQAAATDVIYLRLSQFHFFTTLVLKFKKNVTFLEVNGLLVDDAISANRGALFKSFVQWQERALMRRADGIVSVSKGISDVIRQAYRPAGALITLRNGVGEQFFDDLPSRRSNATGRPKVIYVGTFTPWDGAERLMDLAQAFPGVDFLLVGDGPGRLRLQRNAPPNVSFEGQVSYPELPRYYSQADAGVVLYEVKRHQRVELSSLKTLEYVASGLPVFSTNVPGQEFVAQLGCGVLASEEQLFADFQSFLGLLPVLRAKAQSAREEVRRRYSWENVADLTVQAVRNAATARAASARR
jgi:glycosyltransferase involved in cell wall biosynthesis